MSTRLFLLCIVLLISLTWARGLPKEFLEARIESVSSAALSLRELKGRTVLICLAGRKSFEAGHRQVKQLLEAFPQRPDLSALVVSDLPGVPGFVKATVSQTIEEAHQKASASLGRAPRFYSLLDWEGQYSREFGAAGETQDSYFLLVLDRNQRLRHRSQQNLNGQTEVQLFQAAQQCLRELLP